MDTFDNFILTSHDEDYSSSTPDIHLEDDMAKKKITLDSAMDQMAMFDGMHAAKDNAMVPHVIPQKDLALIAREETNFAEYPFCLMAKRPSPKNPKTLYVNKSPLYTKDKVIVRKFVATGADAYGLPLSGDQDLYVAISMEWSKDGFRSRYIKCGSLYSFLKKYGFGTDGRSYYRFRDGMNRLCGVYCFSDNAFYDRKSKDYISSQRDRGFHVFDSWDVDTADDQIIVVASDFLYRSVKNGNIKEINYDFYQALPSDLTKRLYRYYDKQWPMCKDGKYKISVRLLALLLPLTGEYNQGQIKRVLKPANEILVKSGYLKGFDFIVGVGGEHLITIEFAKVVTKRVSEKATRLPISIEDEERISRNQMIADDIAKELKDTHNIAFYYHILSVCSEDLIFRTLGETKEARDNGFIRTTEGKYFTDLLKRNAKEMGFDLKLKGKKK